MTFLNVATVVSIVVGYLLSSVGAFVWLRARPETDGDDDIVVGVYAMMWPLLALLWTLLLPVKLIVFLGKPFKAERR